MDSTKSAENAPKARKRESLERRENQGVNPENFSSSLIQEALIHKIFIIIRNENV
jgi:hypothetical protein